MISIHEHQFLHSSIGLDEIERVLAWVDSYKLSRTTKKIARDFSDAVLLAEILYHHYPKLVEMHNYPPRSAFLMKMNNWNTLNRKVLKKLKIHLSPKIIEQLSLAVNGVIERVLITVRDKIVKDEEMARLTNKEQEQSSSGGSYYEASASCDDGNDQVLVVPVKHRVNGVLELVQRRVVSHESYLVLKDDLTEAKEAIETLKNKVEHMEAVLKLKDQRIDELQKQLDRKVSRTKMEESSRAGFFSANNSPKGERSPPLSATPKSSVIDLKQQSSVIEVKPPTSGYTSAIPTPAVKTPIRLLSQDNSPSQINLDALNSLAQQTLTTTKPTQKVFKKDTPMQHFTKIVAPATAFPKCLPQQTSKISNSSNQPTPGSEQIGNSVKFSCSVTNAYGWKSQQISPEAKFAQAFEEISEVSLRGSTSKPIGGVFEGRVQTGICESKVSSDESGILGNAHTNGEMGMESCVLAARPITTIEGGRNTISMPGTRAQNSTLDTRQPNSVPESKSQRYNKEAPIDVSPEMCESHEKAAIGLEEKKNDETILEDLLKAKVEKIAKSLDIDLKVTKQIE